VRAYGPQLINFEVRKLQSELSWIKTSSQLFSVLLPTALDSHHCLGVCGGQLHRESSVCRCKCLLSSSLLFRPSKNALRAPLAWSIFVRSINNKYSKNLVKNLSKQVLRGLPFTLFLPAPAHLHLCIPTPNQPKLASEKEGERK
jgi:hypothetical protein